jgi:peptide/nickel transport system substrate-binding protein
MGCLVVSACSTSTTSNATGGAATPVGSTPAPGDTPSTVIPADEGTPQSGGTLVFGIDAEPAGLSPAGNQFATSSMLVASSIFESLTAFDKDAKAQPYLAESLTPDNLATKWTLKLHPNITFSDGEALDANAVKSNLQVQMAGLSSVALSPVKEIDVVDPLTVVFQMSSPWASFPGVIASQVGMMAAPNSFTAPEPTLHPIGTGPFELAQWDHGSKIVTKKNPHYWQSGKPYLDTLEYRFLDDPSSREEALQSGDVNMIYTDSTKTMAGYLNKPGFHTIVDPSGDAQSIVMNQASAPFNNENARKAIVLATDDNAVTDAVGNGVLKPTNQPFSDKNPYHTSDPHYPAFDKAAAKAAADQYQKDTGKPLEFTLTTFTGTDNLVLAQNLQAQWATVGITAHVDAVDQNKAIPNVLTGNTQALLTPNFGYPDPDQNYIFWYSTFVKPIGKPGTNFPHMSNPDLDAALDKGRANLIPSIRSDAYAKATQILNDHFAYVWVYRYVAALIASNDVHGLQQAEQTGFSNIASKPWFQNLWISH